MMIKYLEFRAIYRSRIIKAKKTSELNQLQAMKDEIVIVLESDEATRVVLLQQESGQLLAPLQLFFL